MPPPASRPHRDAILARLQTIAAMTGYDGRVTGTPPHDTDGLVHPYWVLHAGPGEPEASSLAAVHDHLNLSFQVSCVGGDVTRCLAAVDAVRNTLLDQVLTVTGRALAPIRADGSSGNPRVDDAVTPSRLFVAVLFRLRSVPA